MSCSNQALMITSQFLLAIKCTITLIFGIHHRSVSIEPIVSTFWAIELRKCPRNPVEHSLWRPRVH